MYEFRNVSRLQPPDAVVLVFVLQEEMKKMVSTERRKMNDFMNVSFSFLKVINVFQVKLKIVRRKIERIKQREMIRYKNNQVI